MATDHIILMDRPEKPSPIPLPTISDLVKEGLSQYPSFKERKLNPGEAKTKLAFLSFSSGTTGKPKAVAIPHYSIVANVIQHCAHHKINEDYAPFEERRFRPGDVTGAGESCFFVRTELVLNMLLVLPMFRELTLIAPYSQSFDYFL